MVNPLVYPRRLPYGKPYGKQHAGLRPDRARTFAAPPWNIGRPANPVQRRADQVRRTLRFFEPRGGSSQLVPCMHLTLNLQEVIDRSLDLRVPGYPQSMAVHPVTQ